MQTVSLLKDDFKKEESRNIDREIALEKRIKQLDNIKAQQLEPKLYVGDIIEKTNPIVIPDSEETLMLAEESHFWSQNFVISTEPTLSRRPTLVEVPKELPNSQQEKLRLSNAVTQTPSDPEMLKIDVEPITPKLLNKQTAHSAYIKHTQEEAIVLRDLVEHVKSKYPLDQSLEYACRTAHVKHSKLNANPELKCVKCNGCMLSDNHDLCVLDFINNVNARKKSKSVNKSSKRKVWKPTGKVITTTTEVPLRTPTALENETPKPVVTLVYSRKPRKSKTNVPVSKSKVVKLVYGIGLRLSKHNDGDRLFNSPISSISFWIGNVMISRVYYMEGLGHNLFSVGQFCDSNLKLLFVNTPASFVFRRCVNGKKYILVIVYDYSDSNCVSLRSKDGAPDLGEYYEKVGISHETSVAHSLQKNGVVERRNHTLIEAARTMTRAKPSSFNTVCSTISRTDWNILFQPMFDELLTPPPSVDYPATEVVAPIHKVVAPVLAVSTSSPSSTNVDQATPSPSYFQTTPETHPPVIPNDVEEDNHDILIAHMGNDPYFGIPIPEIPSDQSSSSDSIHIIIEAMQEELNESERLEV
ncbi:retrovirus-related pol polyprotein from transposon TNT 1-94 [Tanacetum coccineum]